MRKKSSNPLKHCQFYFGVIIVKKVFHEKALFLLIINEHHCFLH